MLTIDNARARRAWIWVILPLLMYTVAALIVTWPLARHLDIRAAGAGYGDSYEVTRHIWWAREALLDGHNPFNQRALVYPDGFMSWVQWSHPLQYLPGALLALVVSPLAAFNMVLIGTLVLNGMAAYWLGRALTRGATLAALLGGLVFLAFPTVQGHLSVGHLGIVSLYPLPLFALCLWRVVREDAGWRTVAWGALWFTLAALAYVSQLVYVLLPLIVWFAVGEALTGSQRIWQREVPLTHQPWARAAVMVALGGVLLIPFYAPLLTGAGHREMRDVHEPGRITYSADLLAVVSPSPFGPLDDLGLVPDYARDVLGTNSAEGSAYLGVVAVMLALVALRVRAMRVWLWVALGAWLLSLGPLLKWRDTPLTLRIEDIETHIALPWAAFQHLPLLDATRAPGRFNLLTALAISALFSVGAAHVLARLRRDGIRITVAVLLALIVLVEYQLFAPFATDDAAQPAYFRELAEVDGVRAVYNVPATHNLAAKYALYQQTLHHKPLIAGHALRRTIQDPALLAVLDRALLGGAHDVLPPISAGTVPALLAEAGADRVILHKQFVRDAGAAVARLREMLGDPEFEDARHAAFVVPPTVRSADHDLLFAASEDGWNAPLDLGAFTGAFLADRGEWHFTTPRDLYGELVIPAQGYAVPRQIAVHLDGNLIAGVWAAEGAVRVPVWTAPGYHTLAFEAVNGCTAYPFTVTCLAGRDCAALDPPLCVSAAFGAPTWEPFASAPALLDVPLDHGVRLRAFDVQRLDDPRAVRVHLFWDAKDALPESYALFVHVADPDSATPFAQATAYPALLTTDWDGGAQWVSDVVIPLDAGIPAGEYAINAGWFDPLSGKRLGVRGSRPWADAGIVALTTIMVE